MKHAQGGNQLEVQIKFLSGRNGGIVVLCIQTLSLQGTYRLEIMSALQKKIWLCETSGMVCLEYQSM